MKSKKGQFFIFSAMFLMLLLIYLYSLETDNTYIISSSNVHLQENIIYETCQVGYNSIPGNIEERFTNFTNDVSQYCDGFGYTCTLSINIVGSPPTPDYTDFTYSIFYSASGYESEEAFVC